MTDSLINPGKLNEIVQKAIEYIDESKKQIFVIAEEAKKEWNELNEKLQKLQEQVKKTIAEVDQLEVLEKDSRWKLMVVSRDFAKYTEEDVRRAYQEAQNLQLRLALEREHEQGLIAQRTELEKRIRRIQATVDRAEQLANHVGGAMTYLNNALLDVSDTLEELRNKEALGIQIIHAQEEERQRVARVIHDGPAQSLSNIVLKCDICEKMADLDIKKAKDEIKDLKRLVRSSLSEIRKIIFDLRPMSLDDLGLVPTLNRYVSNYEDETGIEVIFDSYDQDSKIDPIIEVAVFRVIQEALNNIRKFAGARQVYIQIKIRNGILFGTVIDTGVGFDIEEYLKSWHGGRGQNSFGLFEMRQRIELLKGEFSISSENGKGTRVHWKIPLDHTDKEEQYE